MGNNLTHTILIKEIRCEKDAQHRLQAARLLLKEKNFLDRMSYLCSMVFYDPDLSVRAQVKELLFEQYGNEMESVLREEASIGEPFEVPWMLPCSLEKTPVPDQEVQDLLANKDYAGLQNVLRDPMDSERRIQAARALAEDTSAENLEMLAKSVLFDPDEDVQQQAYQSLYEAAGQEKADSLINELGEVSLSADEEWLLIPDEQDFSETGSQENSLFGIQKDYQIRGLLNMYATAKDPSESIKILTSLCQIKDIQVNEILARVALFDERQKAKDFARAELESRFGEGLEEYLEFISEHSSSTYSEDEEEDYEEDVEKERVSDFSAQLNAQSSVIQEGNNNLLLALVSGLVVIAIFLFFVFR